MIIEIPFKTPTINHLYGQRGFRKFLKPEAKALKKKIFELVNGLDKDIALNSNLKLKVTTEIYEDWICQNGSVAKKDISNREKFLIDSVFEALDLDDKYIFEQTFKKIISFEQKAVIKIEVITNELEYTRTMENAR